jgi:glycosyltransferase involved in cell wall biosynthesis
MIGEALDSVLAQTALSRIIEIIVVDDGSSDASRDVIWRYAAQHPLVVPLFKPNGGVSSARNAGIARATAPYIAFLDGDDVWYPDKLAVQLVAAADHPSVAVFYGDFECEEEGHRNVTRARRLSQQTPDPLKDIFLHGVTILPSAAMIRKDVLAQLGGFDESLAAMNDGELWTRIALRHAFLHVEGTLLRKRERPDNLTAQFALREMGRRRISEQVFALRPDLLRYRGKRTAYIETQCGLAALAKDEKSAARRRFLKAAVNAPFSPRGWIYVAMTLLPGTTRSHINAAKRALRRISGRILAH